jgi:methionine-rich copper-binding protein CopC
MGMLNSDGSCERILLCALIILLLSVEGNAHAVLTESDPATDAVVKCPHLTLTLKFNVRIDAARSQLYLLLPDGRTVALHPKPDMASNIISAEASNVMPGKYKLVWQVLASDGHITRGEIPFSAR